MQKTSSIIFSVIILLLVGVLLWWLFLDNASNEMPEDRVVIEEEFDGKVVYAFSGDGNTSDLERDCQERGGTFNECGSPCAADAEACIEVCAFTCEFRDGEDNDDLFTDAELFTYVFDAAGVEMSYPSPLMVREGVDEVTFGYLGPTQTEGTELFDGIAVTLRVENLDVNQTLEQFAQEQIEALENVGEVTESLHDTMLADKDAVQFSVSAIGNYTHVYTSTPDGDVLAVIYLAPDPGNRGYSDVVQNMINSLQFSK